MTDDTQLVQQAADSGAMLPGGRLVISSTIVLDKMAGCVVRGHGGMNRSPNPNWERKEHCTVIEWAGAPDEPMFLVKGVLGGRFSDLTLVGEAAAGVQFRHGWGTLQFKFDFCSFMGMEVGVRWGEGETENTCANCSYIGCYWQDCQACVRLVNNQSLEHSFFNPQFNASRVGVDIEHGGSVHILGGGSHSLTSLLRVDRVGSNTRGLSVRGFRCDSGPDRTCWLETVEPTRRRTLGAVLFEAVSQITHQKHSDLPLLTLPPGGIAKISCCNFNEHHPSYADGSLVHCHADERAVSEAYFEYCDGLSASRLDETVTLRGEGNQVTFARCGTGAERLNKVVKR